MAYNKYSLRQMPCRKQRGFTLIEMITVIVLLGIISVGIGSVIRFGSQIFVDVTSRDELLSSARFAIERLNREVRSALPNSIRVLNDTNDPATRTRQCLEFIPAQASAVYIDIPVAPELASDTMSVIKFDRPNNIDDLFAVTYPLFPGDLYGGGTATPEPITSLPAVAGNIWTLTLDNSILFSQDSPTKRLYFVDYPVSYCVQNGILTRHEKSDFSAAMLTSGGVMMAENLELMDIGNPTQRYFPFTVSAATHIRNAILTTELRFEKNDERLTFNNETQVMNVP